MMSYPLTCLFYQTSPVLTFSVRNFPSSELSFHLSPLLVQKNYSNQFNFTDGHFSNFFWVVDGGINCNISALCGWRGLIKTFYFRKSSNMWIQEDFSSFSLCKEAKLAAEYKNIYRIVNL